MVTTGVCDPLCEYGSVHDMFRETKKTKKPKKKTRNFFQKSTTRAVEATPSRELPFCETWCTDLFPLKVSQRRSWDKLDEGTTRVEKWQCVVCGR